MTNELIVDTLLQCVQKERNNQDSLTNEQWVTLLNGYVHHEPITKVARQLDMRPLQVNYWYYHFTLELTNQALQKSAILH